MQSYSGLDRQFASHETVDHSRGEYVRGIVHVNFSESYFSLLKRGIFGAFHHVSRQHMQRYLEEFDFRWNRRKIDDFERLLEAVPARKEPVSTTALQHFWCSPTEGDALVRPRPEKPRPAVQLRLPFRERGLWRKGNRRRRKRSAAS